jgi:1,4-dihydroxy-2-naphthoyl-CoA synthase
MENILIEKQDHIAIITINRPTKLNALNKATIQELHDGFKALNEDKLVKVMVAYDKDGNIVEYNETTVQAYIAANEYKTKRAAEYPSIVDHLDTIYHDGIDAWKEQINTIKEKYPKG